MHPLQSWTFALTAVLALPSCQDSGITRHNQPPTVEITWPEEGSTLRVGEPLTFVAMAGDDFTATPNLDVQWISTRSGVLEGSLTVDESAVMLTVEDLEVGAHRVTVEVMDGEGLTASDEVGFEVLSNAAPEVELLQPSQDGVYLEGQAIPVSVQVSDEDDAIVDLSLAWSGSAASVDLPEAPDSDGAAVGYLVGLAAGAWTLSVEVTDPMGDRATDSVGFTVEVAPEPTTISLGTMPWQATGTAEEDEVGASLDVGDLTGDGVPDLVVGSPSSTSSAPDDHEISVFAGPLGTGTTTIDDADAQVLAASHHGLGYSLAADQDLDGDGFADLAAGFMEMS